MSSSLTLDARQSALLNAIALRPLNWQICQAVNYAVWHCTSVEVELKSRRAGAGQTTVVVLVQGSEMSDMASALEFINYICSNARHISKIRVNVEVADVGAANLIFRTLANGKRIQLHDIRVRRRYVGQQFLGLIDLIRAQAPNLKVIGKLGLGEAIQAFDHNIHLERLSLINFDLVQDGEMQSDALAELTRFSLRRLAGLGATFKHLSYTTYSGFEITRNPGLHMLKTCQVTSIRLTQQEGIAISDPSVPRPLLPNLRRIELVGCMDTQCKDLEVLFPSLEAFHVQRQDLVTGGAFETRSPSASISEQNREWEMMTMHFPIASAS